MFYFFSVAQQSKLGLVSSLLRFIDHIKLYTQLVELLRTKDQLVAEAAT